MKFSNVVGFIKNNPVVVGILAILFVVNLVVIQSAVMRQTNTDLRAAGGNYISSVTGTTSGSFDVTFCTDIINSGTWKATFWIETKGGTNLTANPVPVFYYPGPATCQTANGVLANISGLTSLDLCNGLMAKVFWQRDGIPYSKEYKFQTECNKLTPTVQSNSPTPTRSAGSGTGSVTRAPTDQLPVVDTAIRIIEPVNGASLVLGSTTTFTSVVTTPPLGSYDVWYYLKSGTTETPVAASVPSNSTNNNSGTWMVTGATGTYQVVAKVIQSGQVKATSQSVVTVNIISNGTGSGGTPTPTRSAGSGTGSVTLAPTALPTGNNGTGGSTPIPSPTPIISIIEPAHTSENVYTGTVTRVVAQVQNAYNGSSLIFESVAPDGQRQILSNIGTVSGNGNYGANWTAPNTPSNSPYKVVATLTDPSAKGGAVRTATVWFYVFAASTPTVSSTTCSGFVTRLLTSSGSCGSVGGNRTVTLDNTTRSTHSSVLQTNTSCLTSLITLNSNNDNPLDNYDVSVSGNSTYNAVSQQGLHLTKDTTTNTCYLNVTLINPTPSSAITTCQNLQVNVLSNGQCNSYGQNRAGNAGRSDSTSYVNYHTDSACKSPQFTLNSNQDRVSQTYTINIAGAGGLAAANFTNVISSPDANRVCQITVDLGANPLPTLVTCNVPGQAGQYGSCQDNGDCCTGLLCTDTPGGFGRSCKTQQEASQAHLTPYPKLCRDGAGNVTPCPTVQQGSASPEAISPMAIAGAAALVIIFAGIYAFFSLR